MAQWYCARLESAFPYGSPSSILGPGVQKKFKLLIIYLIMPKKEKSVLKESLNKIPHKKVISKVTQLRNEYKKQVSTAIITAFGLVIALVWKDVVTALMPSITSPALLAKYPVLANLYTAIIITIIAVIGILVMSRLGKSSE